LPQIILQLWESFALGYTFGGFKTFSIGLSIVLFQTYSASFLPEILEVNLNSIKKDKSCKLIMNYVIIFLVWVCPYVLASIPFLAFFHPNREDWYAENGFVGIDWDIKQQYFLFYFIIFLYVVFIAFFFLKANIVKIVHDNMMK